MLSLASFTFWPGSCAVVPGVTGGVWTQVDRQVSGGDGPVVGACSVLINQTPPDTFLPHLDSPNWTLSSRSLGHTALEVWAKPHLSLPMPVGKMGWLERRQPVAGL